jgi:hypothetical protein
MSQHLADSLWLLNRTTRRKIIARLMTQQERLKVKIDRLNRYAILGEDCSASDSEKPVFDCWCPECKEITSSIIKHDRLPEWLA